VAALTINSQREKVIDFTEPFLMLGISVLSKRSDSDNEKLNQMFYFLYPFSFEIWFLTFLAWLCKYKIIIFSLFFSSFKSIIIT